MSGQEIRRLRLATALGACIAAFIGALIFLAVAVGAPRPGATPTPGVWTFPYGSADYERDQYWKDPAYSLPGPTPTVIGLPVEFK